MTDSDSDSTKRKKPRSDRRAWKRLAKKITTRLRVPNAQVSAEGCLTGLHQGACLESFGAWLSYEQAADLFEVVATADAADGIDLDHDLRTLDTHAQVGAQIGMRRAITAGAGDTLLTEALALRHRLPKTALCLRDGLLTPAQVKIVIRLTDLIEDPDILAAVDAQIADLLRGSDAGCWDTPTVRNLVNGRVFELDPDSVREARKRATDERATWVSNGVHGMMNIGGSMTAENAHLAHAAVQALARTVCRHDTRTKKARASDAMYSLLAGEQFTCLCGRGPDCDAQIPLPQQFAKVHDRIEVHVVLDAATLNDDADHPGFLDGHGTISADHARHIATRPDTHIHHLTGLDHDPTTDTDGAADADAERDIADVDDATDGEDAGDEEVDTEEAVAGGAPDDDVADGEDAGAEEVADTEEAVAGGAPDDDVADNAVTEDDALLDDDPALDDSASESETPSESGEPGESGAAFRCEAPSDRDDVAEPGTPAEPETPLDADTTHTIESDAPEADAPGESDTADSDTDREATTPEAVKQSPKTAAHKPKKTPKAAGTRKNRRKAKRTNNTKRSETTATDNGTTTSGEVPPSLRRIPDPDPDPDPGPPGSIPYLSDAPVDPGVWLPTCLPSNPYRPSTALDTYVRIRDGGCSVPGCHRPAWRIDLDHVHEYDHTDPDAGGRTHPDDMNAKCRFHHMLKTFGNWVDDQYRTPDATLHTEVVTPQGVVITGRPHTNTSLFGGLARYRWYTPAPTTTSSTSGEHTISVAPTRAATRTQNKHARRRAERNRNRRDRERREEAKANQATRRRDSEERRRREAAGDILPALPPPAPPTPPTSKTPPKKRPPRDPDIPF